MLCKVHGLRAEGVQEAQQSIKTDMTAVGQKYQRPNSPFLSACQKPRAPPQI